MRQTCQELETRTKFTNRTNCDFDNAQSLNVPRTDPNEPFLPPEMRYPRNDLETISRGIIAFKDPPSASGTKISKARI